MGTLSDPCKQPYFLNAELSFIQYVLKDWDIIDDKAMQMSIDYTFYLLKYYDLSIVDPNIEKFSLECLKTLYLSIINRTRISKVIQNFVDKPPLSISKKIVILRAGKCIISNYCSTDNLTAHHVIHRSMGGDDSVANLQCVCTSCHASLHEILKLPSGANILHHRDSILKHSMRRAS